MFEDQQSLLQVIYAGIILNLNSVLEIAIE